VRGRALSTLVAIALTATLLTSCSAGKSELWTQVRSVCGADPPTEPLYSGRPLAATTAHGLLVAVFSHHAFIGVCIGRESGTLLSPPLRRSALGRHAMLPLATVMFDGVFWTLVATKPWISSVRIATSANGWHLDPTIRVDPGLFLGSFTGGVREAIAVAYQSSRAVATVRVERCWYLGFMLFNRAC